MHPFIKDQKNREPHLNDLSKNMTSKIENLKKYADSSLLKRIVYTALTQRLSFKEIEDLQEIFMLFDIDNDGVISQEEFTQGLQNLKIKTEDDEFKKIFDMMDSDKSKRINYSEFISASIDKKFLESSGKLREVFDSFDKDKNGKISYNEFKEAMNIDGIDNRSFLILKKEFDEADINKDGFIDFEEFNQHITDSRDRVINKKSKNWYKYFSFEFFFIFLLFF